MRTLPALAAALLALPAVVIAQGAGLPIMNSGVAAGVTVAADVGFPDDLLGGGTAYGASANVGFGILGLGAQVVRHAWDGEGVDGTTSFGGTAALRLLGGPLTPFRVQLQAGYARWDLQIDDIAGISQTRGTASLGFAATIPVPAFAIKPWVAPRVQRTESGGNGFTEYGVSGGIEFGFLNGMTLRTAYDRTWLDRNGFSAQPGIWSVGLGWGL
jgi:opacity protein-like surface antigen